MTWRHRMRWRRDYMAAWVFSHSSQLMVTHWLQTGVWGWRYRKPKALKGKARVGGFDLPRIAWRAKL